MVAGPAIVMTAGPALFMTAGSALITTAGSVVTVIVMITVTITIAVAVAVTVMIITVAVAVIIAVTIRMTMVITVIMVASIASTAGRTTTTVMAVAMPAVTTATTTTVTPLVRTTTRPGMTRLLRTITGFVTYLMAIIARSLTRRVSLLYFYFPITDLGRVLFELFKDGFCDTFILVADKAETMTLNLQLTSFNLTTLCKQFTQIIFCNFLWNITYMNSNFTRIFSFSFRKILM